MPDLPVDANAGCRRVLAAHHRNPDFADQFVAEIVAPQLRRESLAEYETRCMQAMEDYIAMSDHDRRMLHAGLEDGVPWRGEPIAIYLDVVNETGLFERMDFQAYLGRLKVKIRKLEEKTHGSVSESDLG